jgi:hypothetical protein
MFLLIVGDCRVQKELLFKRRVKIAQVFSSGFAEAIPPGAA